jgi:hypothetical protein
LLSSTGPAGYTVTSLTCSNTGDVEVNSVTLGLGESVTCTFVIDDDASATLSGLSLAGVDLIPFFQRGVNDYSSVVGYLKTDTTVTATATDPAASLTLNDSRINSGETSDTLLLSEGVNTILIDVTARDGRATETYVVQVTRQTVDGFAQQAYIKASNTGAEDGFGWDVALHGDTLAVGARAEDSAATGIDGSELNNDAFNAGAVYVFTRDSAGTWSQQAYIKASNTGGGDRFGSSVSLYGDTLAVGALNEDSAATGINGDQADDSDLSSGAVYVFTRDSAGTWSQQAYVKASNTGRSDNFGASVSLYGDTLAVGAAGEDSAATGINGDQTDNSAKTSGAVYVFARDGAGTWSQQAYVKASNTGADDYFGISVALHGDTLAVGAYLEDSAATGINGSELNNDAGQSGAVYVFTRDNTGTWSQQAYIKASSTGGGDNTAGGDWFGWSVSLYGDTLAVGAAKEDSAATGIDGDQADDNDSWAAGAVYVFTRDVAGTWSQQAYVKASNTGGNDQFGRSVALHGDALAVSALYEDSAATGINGDQTDDSGGMEEEVGAVYVFARDGAGTWRQQAYVKASNAGVEDYFGISVALHGDNLAVGAYEDSAATGINGDQTDNSAKNSGAVYVFR